MWRIRHLDGRLFDMVNLSRAKDAAISVTLCILNRSRESTPVPSPMGETGLPVALVTSTPEPAPEPAL
jgi:hypothetical protein